MDEAWEVSVGTPPSDLDIHVQVDELGLTLWRDPPSRAALLREAIAPPVLIGIFSISLAILAVRAVASRNVVLEIGLVFGCGLWVRYIADWWQNAGVMTRIEVRGDTLSWTKKTLWRESVGKWPLRSIRGVRINNFMVKISRSWRVPLGAFAYRRREHLEWVVNALSGSIEARRSLTFGGQQKLGPQEIHRTS